MQGPHGIGLYGAVLLAGLLAADASAQVLQRAQIPAQSRVLRQAVTPAVAPTQAVVAAAQGWAPSGVSLQRGGRLTLTAEGRWSVGGALAATVASNVAFAGPDGIAGRTSPRALLPSANVGALIGKIGENGAPFVIGSKYDGAVAADGPLLLAINDDAGAFADNQGRLAVAVTAVAPTIAPPRVLIPGAILTPRPIPKPDPPTATPQPNIPTATPTDTGKPATPSPRPGATRPTDTNVPGRTPTDTPGATRPPAATDVPPTRPPATQPTAPPPSTKPPSRLPPPADYTPAPPADTQPADTRPPVDTKPPAAQPTPEAPVDETSPVAEQPAPTNPASPVPKWPEWVTPVAILGAAALALLLLLQLRARGQRRDEDDRPRGSATGIGSRVADDGRAGQTLSVKWRGR